MSRVSSKFGLRVVLPRVAVVLLTGSLGVPVLSHAATDASANGLADALQQAFLTQPKAFRSSANTAHIPGHASTAVPPAHISMRAARAPSPVLPTSEQASTKPVPQRSGPAPTVPAAIVPLPASQSATTPNEVNLVRSPAAPALPNLNRVQVPEALPALSTNRSALADYLQLVTNNNDAYRIAQQQLREAQAEHLDAVGRFFPKLQLQEQGQLYRNVSGVPSATLVGSNIVLTQGSIYSNYLSLVASLNLFAGGSDVERIMAANQGIAQAQSEILARRNQALVSALLAYDNLVSVWHQVQVGRQAAENANLGLKLVEQRWQRGNASLLAVTQQRTQLLQALSQLESLQKKLTEAENQMVLLAGSSQAFPLLEKLSERQILPQPPQTITPEELSDAWRLAPAVEAARHAYRQAGHEVNVVRGSFLPQVDLQGSYNWLGSSSANFGDALNAVQRNSYTIGLTITQSLAPFTGHLARLHTAEAKHEISSVELQQAVLKAKTQVRQAAEELRMGKLRVQSYQAQAEAAAKAAQFAKDLYEHGREDLLQEKQAMLSALAAKLVYQETQQQYATAQWIAYSLRNPERFAAALLQTVAQ